jgi:hypothetical protein
MSEAKEMKSCDEMNTELGVLIANKDLKDATALYNEMKEMEKLNRSYKFEILRVHRIGLMKCYLEAGMEDECRRTYYELKATHFHRIDMFFNDLVDVCINLKRMDFAADVMREEIANETIACNGYSLRYLLKGFTRTGQLSNPVLVSAIEEMVEAKVPIESNLLEDVLDAYTSKRPLEPKLASRVYSVTKKVNLQLNGRILKDLLQCYIQCNDKKNFDKLVADLMLLDEKQLMKLQRLITEGLKKFGMRNKEVEEVRVPEIASWRRRDENSPATKGMSFASAKTMPQSSEMTVSEKKARSNPFGDAKPVNIVDPCLRPLKSAMKVEPKDTKLKVSKPTPENVTEYAEVERFNNDQETSSLELELPAVDMRELFKPKKEEEDERKMEEYPLKLAATGAMKPKIS